MPHDHEVPIIVGSLRCATPGDTPCLTGTAGDRRKFVRCWGHRWAYGPYLLSGASRDSDAGVLPGLLLSGRIRAQRRQSRGRYIAESGRVVPFARFSGRPTMHAFPQLSFVGV